jgi:hypothetical protein
MDGGDPQPPTDTGKKFDYSPTADETIDACATSRRNEYASSGSVHFPLRIESVDTGDDECFDVRNTSGQGSNQSSSIVTPAANSGNDVINITEEMERLGIQPHPSLNIPHPGLNQVRTKPRKYP